MSDNPQGAHKTLRHLIQASGYAGTSGQSFRNNVAGAASGRKMTDYVVHSWDFDAGQPAPETYYDSGHTFTIGVSFVLSPAAGYIQRTGNVVTVTSDIGFGGSISYSSSIVASSTGSTLSLTITARFRTDAIINVAYGQFFGYGVGEMPADNLTHSIQYHLGVSGGGTPGTQTVNMNLFYNIDAGGFNGFFSTAMQVNMNDRPATIDDFDSIQWSWDGGTTIQAGTGKDSPLKDEAAVGDTTTVWYRARLTGGSYGAWTAVSFDDTRATE